MSGTRARWDYGKAGLGQGWDQDQVETGQVRIRTEWHQVGWDQDKVE